MFRSNLVTLAVVLALHCSLNAQSPKLAVAVIPSANTDSVGLALAYAVREEVRRSAVFELVAATKDSIVRIRLQTMDLALPGQPIGVSSAVGVTLTMKNLNPFVEKDPQTWYPLHLASTIMLCGRDRVDSQAKGIVALLDEEVQAYQAERKK